MARLPLLPADLSSALKEVGSKLRQGGDAGGELKTALGLLASLKPAQIARADREIAEAAGLHHRLTRALVERLLSPRPTETEQLLALPGLEYLFLFHHDGRLREAALLNITGGLPTPFLFAAVLWRLNDWAEPVREAAARCANRSFPVTAPSIVARSALELLVRQASWGRLQDERMILDRVFDRDDVAMHLAEMIEREPTGPQASTLRHALCRPALDRHLERLARHAVQPSVRAVAVQALISGEAEWPSGIGWQWIDKSMGLKRRVQLFARRPLSVAPPRKVFIEQGVNDRSAVVRRVALAGVIRHLLGTAEASGFATSLLQDRSLSVRQQAEFILRRSVV